MSGVEFFAASILIGLLVGVVVGLVTSKMESNGYYGPALLIPISVGLVFTTLCVHLMGRLFY